MYKHITEYIRSLFHEPSKFIPLHEPRFNGNEKKYVLDCIDTTFVSSVGKYVDLFEKEIAKYTGAKYAVACVNGTAALHIALMLSDVKAGDEVITQPLTFIATANAISYTGAAPVFIDVDIETMGLSPSKMQKWLNENTFQKENPNTGKSACYNKHTNKRIAACVPMHTFGFPCKIDEIKQICETFSIVLIEDAAESLGSFYKGQHTGTFGLWGTLSFNGNKTITTGGGGMLITNDELLAKKAKHLTTQAKVPHAWEYVHDYTGYNYRLTNINAALGVAQMEQLETFIEKKRKLAECYKNFFNGNEIKFYAEPQDSKANYWLNSIELQSKKQRDEFLQYTNNAGIMTRPIWQLMNKLQMYKNCQTDNLTNANYLEERIVNIPSSVRIGE